jgi:hypothetical protein
MSEKEVCGSTARHEDETRIDRDCIRKDGIGGCIDCVNGIDGIDCA